MEIWMPVTIVALFLTTAAAETLQRQTAPFRRETLRLDRWHLQSRTHQHRLKLTAEVSFILLFLTGGILALTGNNHGVMPPWAHHTAVIALAINIIAMPFMRATENPEITGLRHRQEKIDEASPLHWTKATATLACITLAAVALYASTP